MDNEFEFKKYTVTCETEGCGNANVAIIIDAPATNPFFICGVCGNTIVNIVD